MKISLVIPAYNEERIIADTIKKAKEYLEKTFAEYELIIVNDGSTDNTEAIVRGLLSETVHVAGYSKNSGKGCAVRTGMLIAGGDLVFYTDADLAYGLEVIGDAVQEFERTGADVVIGSRRLDPDGYGNYPPIRLIASRCFSLAARICSGMKYDMQCGFKGFRKDTSDRIFKNCTTDSFAFDVEAMLIVKNLGASIVQIPVRVLNHGESKVRMLRDSVLMLYGILAIRAKVRKRELK